MAINFTELPKENPFAIPEPGIYKGVIVETEMRNGKESGKPYLSLKIDLHDDTKKVGTLYDMLSESDSSVVQFKIARFLTACGIPLQGAMELADIGKIVNGKTIVIDTMLDKKADPGRQRLVVDVFSRGAYYPLSEYEQVKREANPSMAQPIDDFMAVADEETCFNAADGAAVNPVSNY